MKLPAREEYVAWRLWQCVDECSGPIAIEADREIDDIPASVCTADGPIFLGQDPYGPSAHDLLRTAYDVRSSPGRDNSLEKGISIDVFDCRGANAVKGVTRAMEYDDSVRAPLSQAIQCGIDVMAPNELLVHDLDPVQSNPQNLPRERALKLPESRADKRNGWRNLTDAARTQNYGDQQTPNPLKPFTLAQTNDTTTLTAWMR